MGTDEWWDKRKCAQTCRWMSVNKCEQAQTKAERVWLVQLSCVNERWERQGAGICATHVLNFRDPEKCSKWANHLDKQELFWANNIVDMEDHHLNKGLEVLSDQTISAINLHLLLTHHMPFTFYHMIAHMTLSFLSYYLCLSLISLIYILMESSQISITPYNVTLLIVITHSTFIPTHAKSSLPYGLLIFRLPLADYILLSFLHIPIGW